MEGENPPIYAGAHLSPSIRAVLWISPRKLTDIFCCTKRRINVRSPFIAFRLLGGLPACVGMYSR